MKKSDVAAENFAGRCNCCQAVFLAYCEEHGMDAETAFKVSAGFGGGMGRLQEVCGALTGAFMAIGLKYHGDKALCYEKIREMGKLFREENGELTCLGLLGYDLSCEDQARAASEADVFKAKCPGFVKSSADILEKIL